jgi:hypothetical protein
MNQLIPTNPRILLERGSQMVVYHPTEQRVILQQAPSDPSNPSHSCPTCGLCKRQEFQSNDYFRILENDLKASLNQGIFILIKVPIVS